MKHLCLLCLVLLLPFCLFAESDDDTLKYYLSKSQLVIEGKIATSPSGQTDEVDVFTYFFDFQVSDVLKGDAKFKGQTIAVHLVCLQRGKWDENPLLKKDTRCILFLNEKPASGFSAWIGADFWFAIQYPSSVMAEHLKRLAKEK